jgi:hypothetical protein
MAEIVRLRPRPGPRPPGDADTIHRLQAWLRRVMASQQPPLSAEAWANKAGVAGTSITRFLRHGYPVPKTSTLAKPVNPHVLRMARPRPLPPQVVHRRRHR